MKRVAGDVSAPEVTFYFFHAPSRTQQTYGVDEDCRSEACNAEVKNPIISFAGGEGNEDSSSLSHDKVVSN